MALDPKTAREEREAKKVAESVPPELNPPFPYTRLPFGMLGVGGEVPRYGLETAAQQRAGLSLPEF